MESKKCTKCHIIKSISEFVKNKSMKNGYAYWCKHCIKAYRLNHLKKHNIGRAYLPIPDVPPNHKLLSEISGFESLGKYCISIDGAILSCSTSSYWKKLKQRIDTKGYCQFSYTINGKRLYISTHRIVALAFIPKINGKLYINHKNGIKTDNRVENLEWVSPSENIKHSYNKLNHKRVNGSNNHNSKLTEKDIPMIFKLLENGHSMRKIAKQYNVHHSIIYGIKSGLRWKHVI